MRAACRVIAAALGTSAVLAAGCRGRSDRPLRIRTLRPQALRTHLRTVIHVDGATLLTAGFGGAIARSTDGGRSWARVPSGTRARLYGGTVSPSPHRTVWLVGENGTVLSSRDDGATFQRDSTPTDERLLAVTVTPSRRVVAVGDGGIVLSRDRSASWRIARAPEPGVAGLRAIVPRGDGESLLAMGYDGLRVVEQGDGIWRREDAAAGDAVYGLASSSQEIWGCGAFGSITRSVDGGASFEPVASTTRAFLRSIAFHGRTGIAAGLGTIVLSSDGGATWRTVLHRYTAQILAALPLDDRSAVAVGEFGTILRTEDAGATWEPVGGLQSFSLRAAAWPADSVMLTMGEQGMCLRSTDGGTTFSAIDSGVRATVSALSMWDERRGLAAHGGSTLLATNDGGASWQTAATIGAGRLDTILCLPSGDAVAAGRDGSYLTMEGDTGAWTVAGSPLHGRAMALAIGGDPFPYWIAGEEGLLASVRRFAGPELALYTGSTQDLHGCAVCGERLYAVGTGGTVLSSWNLGRGSSLRIEALAGAPNLRAIACDAAHPEAAIAAGDGGVVFTTRDGGKTWMHQVIDPEVSLRAIAMRDHRAIVAGDWGAIYLLTF